MEKNDQVKKSWLFGEQFDRLDTKSVRYDLKSSKDSITGTVEKTGLFIKYNSYFCIDLVDGPRLFYKYNKDSQADRFLKKLSKIDWKGKKITIDSLETEALITYNSSSGETRYLGSEAKISATGLEGEKIKSELYEKSSFSNDERDQIIKELSAKFNRTEEEIRSYIESNINSTAGSTDLKDYLKKELDDKSDDLVGAYTRDGLGQTVRWNENKWETYNNDDVKLFDRYSAEGVQTSIIFNYSFKKEKGAWKIIKWKINGQEQVKVNNVGVELLKAISENGLFAEYSKNSDKLYLSIVFEDPTMFAKSFNSYYFILNTEKERETFYDRYGLLRYLMYIKQVENARMNEEKHKKAIESAIAAIMSRNMSHNLGSHFLYYSQQDSANLSGSLHDMFYEKDVLEEQTFIQKNTSRMLRDRTIESYKYIKGASKVFEFLQDRMYYLAAITGIERSQSLPVLLKSQVLDFITEKTDFRNFYLNNLVRSEQYTLDSKTLSVQLDSCSKDVDDLSISLPLGSVSIHAIYNIFENFIRNSAKYQWSNKKKPDSLEFTIKVIARKNDSDIRIQIFDNKKSANRVQKSANLLNNGVTLKQHMNIKLENIHFLDADDTLNNDDKGLKEMLLSAFWINNRQKDKSIGEIIYDFEKSEKKDEFLKKYGLVFLADSGGNLGVEFHVNKHYYVLKQSEIKAKPYLTSDIVIVSDAESKEYEYGREVSKSEKLESNIIDTLKKYVVAPLDIKQNEDCKNTINLLKSINGRFGFIDSLILDINDSREKNKYNQSNLCAVWTDHMSTDVKKLGGKVQIERRYNSKKRLYSDSISGGNWTNRLKSFRGRMNLDGPCYTTWKDKYFSLMLKETALTRIAIIDERFFNTISYLSIGQYVDGQPIKGTSIELDFKNIQVLNLLSELQKPSARDVRFTKRTKGRYKFVGNEFRDANTTKIPHFLSIHFGIIQKLLKRDELNMSEESVNTVIRNVVKEIYGDSDCDNIRVTIHSGRGTLSKQEREALSEYNVIPLGALRSAFLDSKYILCQLFYNLRYKKIKR